MVARRRSETSVGEHLECALAAHTIVVKVAASTEGDEAPRGQGATTENIQPYLREKQRSPRGCIVGRTGSPACGLHTLGAPNAVATFTTGCQRSFEPDRQRTTTSPEGGLIPHALIA
jgi:hypothetical protein